MKSGKNGSEWKWMEHISSWSTVTMLIYSVKTQIQ